MMKDIIEAWPLPNLHLWIRFEDGVEGIIAVAEHVRLDGIFAPLLDPAEFARVRVNTELGCVEWPSGADLDPDVLYALLTNFDAIKQLQRQHS